MKNLKTFEKFSRPDAKKLLLEGTGLMGAFYDLKEAALEYLDEDYAEEYDDDQILHEKKLYWNADLYDKNDTFLSTLIYSSYKTGQSIEKNLIWQEEQALDQSYEEIAGALLSGEMRLEINFAVVFGVPGDETVIGEDSSALLETMMGLHPEFKWDTLSQFDIY